MTKAAGFLKIHSRYIECSKELELYLTADVRDAATTEAICGYLASGTMMIAFLHYYMDGETPIEPAAIYSDGVWIWPSYYSYYIRKHPNLLVPAEFVTRMRDNLFCIPELSNENKMYVEYMLAKLLKVDRRVMLQLPKAVSALINERGETIQCF